MSRIERFLSALAAFLAVIGSLALCVEVHNLMWDKSQRELHWTLSAEDTRPAPPPR